MDWLDRLNDALRYMEDNLDGDISYERAARLACTSVYHFQRMFSYIAGVTLSDYIRRRRMTMAAFDLQSGAKVLDTALRYGYESPTAFNRAFHSVHGVPPSAAQKPAVTLKAFPRISFHITIRGDEEMDYKIVKKDAFRIVGIRVPLALDLSYKTQNDVSPDDVAEAFKGVPAFWAEAGRSGKIAEIVKLIGPEPAGLLGATYCKDKGQSYYYIAAATDKPVPEGMFEEQVPACTWAVFSGAGAPNSIQNLMQRVYAEWLPASGYDWDNAPDIEVYLDDDPVNMSYEVWLPVTER
ncbi:MAG: AraC family transcriptional regulator [Clostridiales bacterium]|nr:AraC family transcriptional regulator [Clostridiales bacterium]